MPPLVAFHAGSLGFLAPFPLEALPDVLGRCLLAGPGGGFPLLVRHRLHWKVARGPMGRKAAAAMAAAGGARKGGEGEGEVLNEICVDRVRGWGEEDGWNGGPGARAGGRLGDLVVWHLHGSARGATTVAAGGGSGRWIDEAAPTPLAGGVLEEPRSEVTRAQGDGLLLATPSGSTAYSLAAGGSMVHPSVSSLLLTPICPHSLSFRPLILPDHVHLAVEVCDRAGDDTAVIDPATCPPVAQLTADGGPKSLLWAGDEVRVRLSRHPVPQACVEGATGDWLAAVRDGLHWNKREVVQGKTKHAAASW